jgi:hypothetical protein
MRRFKGECAQFSFNKCLIYAHDGASAKFRTNLQEMDNSAEPFFLKSKYGNPSLRIFLCMHSLGGGGGAAYMYLPELVHEVHVAVSPRGHHLGEGDVSRPQQVSLRCFPSHNKNTLVHYRESQI